MSRRASSLIAGTMLTILTLSPALSQTYADSSSNAAGGSQILNGQIMLHTVVSSLHTTVDNVGQDVGIQSTAAGNTLDVTTMNDTSVTSTQYTSSVDISSDLGARVSNVGGNVGIQGQAICNSAGVSTDPHVTAVTNAQQCDAIDPASNVYVDAVNVGGSMSITNLAAGNTLQADTNAANMPISSTQYNHSNVNATTTAHVANVAGTVAVTSMAVGNSAQILHYSTTP